MKKYILIFFAVILSSCGDDFFSTTLEVDPPTHVDRIVVHAFASATESNIKIKVSKSVALDQDADAEVNNAEIVLSSSVGQSTIIPLDVFSLFPFNYYLEFEDDYFIPGESYTLTVKVDGFEDVTSVQQVPKAVEITSLEFYEDGGINNEGDERSGVDFEFTDPMEENYYEVAVLIDGNLSGNPFTAFSTYLESLDPNTHRGFSFENLLVDDASYNGALKKISVQVYPTTTFQAESKFFFQWRSITKDFYQYSRTLKRFQESQDNPFASPVQIYNNMENGIGIFSISTETYLKF